MKGFTLRQIKGGKLAAGLALVALGILLGACLLWQSSASAPSVGLSSISRTALLLAVVLVLLFGLRFLVDAGKANTVFRAAPEGIYHLDGGQEYLVPWPNIRGVQAGRDKKTPTLELVLHEPVVCGSAAGGTAVASLQYKLAGCSPAPRAVYKQLGEMHLFYTAIAEDKKNKQ